MIKKIINGIFNLVGGLVDACLGPLWAIANSNLPSEIVDALGYIGYFFSFVENGLYYVIDMFCIPKGAMSIIAFYLIFKLSVPILGFAIKIGLKWYHTLVP